MRITVFAIREKGTNRYMPETHGGYSFDNPVECGSGLLPRMFPSSKSAHCSLTQWLRGKHDAGWDDGCMCFEGVTPVPGRKRENMEVVELEITLKEGTSCLGF